MKPTEDLNNSTNSFTSFTLYKPDCLYFCQMSTEDLIENETTFRWCFIVSFDVTIVEISVGFSRAPDPWLLNIIFCFIAIIVSLRCISYGKICMAGLVMLAISYCHKHIYFWELRFSIPVLAAPCSAYFGCLSLLTHLIQIISLLEVRSMHELCSDWHAPYTGSIAPYSLSRGNPLKFTLFRNIHSWICTAQRLHARTSVTSYTSVNIYNFNSRLAHFNALWMEYIHSLRTGIMVEYPVMSTSQGTYVRIEQTVSGVV